MLAMYSAQRPVHLPVYAVPLLNAIVHLSLFSLVFSIFPFFELHCLSIYVFILLLIYLFILFIYLSILLFIDLSFFLFVLHCLFIYIFAIFLCLYLHVQVYNLCPEE